MKDAAEHRLTKRNGCLLFVDPSVVDDLQPGVAAEGEPVAEDDERDADYEVEDFPPYIVKDDRVATVEEFSEKVRCQSTKHEERDAETHPRKDSHHEWMLVVDAAEKQEAGVLRDGACENHEEAFCRGWVAIEIGIKMEVATAAVEPIRECAGSPLCRVAVDHQAHEILQHVAGKETRDGG